MGCQRLRSLEIDVRNLEDRVIELEGADSELRRELEHHKGEKAALIKQLSNQMITIATYQRKMKDLQRVIDRAIPQ